jgi:ubiquinol-cytochrome c reductase subunit 10
VDSGTKAAGLGGVALFAVIFYASGIPRVQRDILQVWKVFLTSPQVSPLTGSKRVPFIGSYFINEIPPEDNVSGLESPAQSTNY